MGKQLKKRPAFAPSSWQAILTSMEIQDEWVMKLEDNTADNGRAAIKRLRKNKEFAHLCFSTKKDRRKGIFKITRENDDPGSPVDSTIS